MKKTTLINLSGMAFRIEEDAYEKLSSYLEAIETQLDIENGDSETINDIESRIAELFASVVHSTDRAVTMSDVEDVIKTIGKPDDFTPQRDDNVSEKKKSDNWKSRRLYRDPNNRIIGGVCSGLGTYFNIDPVIFRILFILGFFSGILLIAYFLLWIIIPKANTIEQHAQMTAGYNQSSQDRRKSGNRNYNRRQYDAKIVKSLKIVLGVIILFFTTIALFALTIAFFVLNFSVVNAESKIYKIWTGELTALFLDTTSTFYAYIGIGLLVFMPLILILYLGLHLVFDFKRGGKLVGLTGFFLWLSGLLFVIFAALNTASQYREHTSISQTFNLQPFDSDTIYIKTSPQTCSYKNLFYLNNLQVTMSDKKIEKDNQITIHKNILKVNGNPTIHINKESENFAITIEKQSYGPNIEKAEEYASKIEYFWTQNNDELLLNSRFSLPENVQVRGQKLKIIIDIPAGKEVVRQ